MFTHNATMLTLNSLFTDYENEKMATPAHMRFIVDPLALVIHWQNGNCPPVETSNPYHREVGELLLDSLKAPVPIEYEYSIESLKRAQTIRDFYKQKYAYTLLMGGELSPFQNSLMRFLTQDNINNLIVEDVGLLISLPKMYIEDTEIHNLMENFKSFPENQLPNKGDHFQCHLTLFTKRSSKLSNKARHDYWFMDKKSQLFRIMVPTYTMESMFLDKLLLVNKNAIDFEGHVYIRKLFHNNFYYAHAIGRYLV